MKFNREKFFQLFRAFYLQTLGVGGLPPMVVTAVTFLLDAFEAAAHWTDVRQIAYALATIAHETAWTFLPIHERGGTNYFNRRYGPQTRVGKTLGNTEPGDGALYAGRGYVQLTGRTNYRTATVKLRAAFPALFAALDLILRPQDAKNSETAFAIMTLGMFEGWFTGKKLSDYIVGKKTNYTGARRVINGQDKAILIAGYAEKFETILRESLHAASGGAPITAPHSPVDALIQDSPGSATAAATAPMNGDFYSDAALVAINKPDIAARIAKPVAAGAALISTAGWGWRIALILAVCVAAYFVVRHRKEIYVWAANLIKNLK